MWPSVNNIGCFKKRVIEAIAIINTKNGNQHLTNLSFDSAQSRINLIPKSGRSSMIPSSKKKSRTWIGIELKEIHRFELEEKTYDEGEESGVDGSDRSVGAKLSCWIDLIWFESRWWWLLEFGANLRKHCPLVKMQLAFPLQIVTNKLL